jgi:glycosyltransferase involved in cell wall biosynthesis
MRAFELTIVDDGSDDEFTHEALKWYADVARVVEQPRGGVGRARNAGIRVSRARFVCCLDADDRLAPDFLQRTVETLERDATLGFVSTGIRLFDEEEGTISGASTALPDVLAVNQFIVSSVFRREAWAAAGGYCETFSHPGIEDWDLWIGIIERGYQAAVLSDPLFEYRVRPGSMSGSMSVPDVWGRLVRELTERHLASYQAHLPAVVGRLAARAAEMRAWALDRERARAWSEHKRESWSSIALERERTISELKDWIAELETAKKWLEEQWQQSKALADARLMEIDTLRSRGPAE